MNKGKFIVFEGIEASGKSTQMNLLTEKLIKKEIKIVDTSEPTNSLIGKLIREAYLSGISQIDHLSLAKLFAADRSNHVYGFIRPTLNNAINVISDRYMLSSLAYQIKENEVSKDTVMSLNCNIIKPDLTIYIDITPEISIERINKRSNRKEIFDNIEKLTIIRNQYLEGINYLSDYNIQIVDGNRSYDAIHNDIMELIDSIILSKLNDENSFIQNKSSLDEFKEKHLN